MATNTPQTWTKVDLMVVVLTFTKVKDCLVFLQVSKKCKSALMELKRCPVLVDDTFPFHLFEDVFQKVETIQVVANRLDSVVPSIPFGIKILEIFDSPKFRPQHILSMIKELHLPYFKKWILQVEMSTLKKLVINDSIQFDSFKAFSLKFTHIELFICSGIHHRTTHEKLPSPPFKLVLLDQHEDCFVPNAQNVLFFNQLINGAPISELPRKPMNFNLNFFGLATNSTRSIQAILPMELIVVMETHAFPIPSIITKFVQHLTIVITDKQPPEPTQRVFFAPQNVLDGTMLEDIFLTNVHHMIFPNELPRLLCVTLRDCSNLDLSKTQTPLLERLCISNSTNIITKLPPHPLSFIQLKNNSNCTINRLHDAYPLFFESNDHHFDVFEMDKDGELNCEGLTRPSLDLSDLLLKRVELTNCTFSSSLTLKIGTLEYVRLNQVDGESVVITSPVLGGCEMDSCSFVELTIPTVEHLVINSFQFYSLTIHEIPIFTHRCGEPPVETSFDTSLYLTLDVFDLDFVQNRRLQFVALWIIGTGQDVDLSNTPVDMLVISGSFRNITLPPGLKVYYNDSCQYDHIWGVELTRLDEKTKKDLIRFGSQEKPNSQLRLDALFF